VTTPSPSGASTPEAILAAWLASPEEARSDIAALCREQPGHAARLRELFDQWKSGHGVLREQGPRGSASAHELASAHAPAELLSRIADRGLGSSRYRLEGEIAHGGMGAVLGVWDEDLRRHLAMKVMRARGAGLGGAAPQRDEKLLARFLEEAQVTGQLDHPGIVPVHELGLDLEGRVYFTMKLVKGQTLKEVFGELAQGVGGWTQARVLGLLLKVCEAMSYAHAKGVIHRDLKPSNVMIGRFGEVFVMDWGLAKVLGRADEKDIRVRTEGALMTTAVQSDRQARSDETPDSPLYTMDGDVVGTPAYMPPEQARGEVEALGPHSDVYALGAMLYHLIAGHMPYLPPGTRATNYAVWRWVQSGPPQPLHEIAPETPAELVAICEKAMAREIARRYPDTAELAQDLSAYVEGRVVGAYETGALAEARKWVRRNRPLAAALAAGVLILVAGLATSSGLYVRASENARRAHENELASNARADDVLRLSALQDLEELMAEADALWPAQPQHIPAYVAWVERAQRLVSQLPQHVRKRAELRTTALPRSEEQRQAERQRHPELGRIAPLAAELAARRRALAQRRDGVAAPLPEVDWSAYPADASALRALAWPRVDPERDVFGDEPLGLALALRALELAGGDADVAATVGDTLAWAYAALGRDTEGVTAMRAALETAPRGRKPAFKVFAAKFESQAAAAQSAEGLRAAEAEIERLEAELAALEARVDERQEWRFPDGYVEARWWDAQLTKLIMGLEDVQTGMLAPGVTTADHGWSIAKRLAFARELESGFASGGKYAAEWARHLPAIRAAYPGLALAPQVGLVPLGPDPKSGLWEFAHLASGAAAERGVDGALVLREETGVVLVLIPGGSFFMGAQSSDRSGQNYDPGARGDEGPVHEVVLSPYFLSKYELTQGQWLRLVGRNPSYSQPVAFTPALLHPVEQVSWLDCMEWLPRAGLALPTEAQWERGARAGTDTPWSTGPERESLRGAVNLADQAAARAQAAWTEIDDWPDLDDGFVVHAPVGSYAPNAFGLHDVHGNVFEWCLDGYTSAFYGESPTQDPLSPWEQSASRVLRSGSFSYAATYARAAAREDSTPSNAVDHVGVRAARAVTE
jgi:formylglycine-generating enzyme required for sulfatase activity/serine/threonine protein kinase